MFASRERVVKRALFAGWLDQKGHDPWLKNGRTVRQPLLTRFLAQNLVLLRKNRDII